MKGYTVQINCAGCHIKVAEVLEGSRIRKGAVMLCADCETKRKASDLAARSRKNTGQDVNDLFKNIFDKTKQ
jgi:hypothetical protein